MYRTLKPVRPLIFLLFAVFLLGCSESPQYSRLPAGSTVLAFGDSVTHGTGAARGEDYPTKLAQRSGWTIVNAGIPGDTAQKAKGRIEDLLKTHNPALVIVELGGNDFLRRRSARDVKEDLRQILQAVRTHGATAVLVAVPEVSLLGASIGSLSDASLYAELAEEEAVLLIPDVFSRVLSDDELRADRIHPNAQGYRELAEGVAEALAEAGLL